MENKIYLKMKNLTKDFPGVKALDDINLEASAGEVLGLVGVNGAGKSTLMSILGGILPPDKGEIFINGNKAEIKNPRIAEDLGIAFIQQEIQVFENLKVFENILISDLHRYSMFKAFPFLNMKRLRVNAKKYLDMFESNIDVDTSVSKLVVGEQQMVQISRALSQGGKILLFDEPTSSLSPKEKQQLFKVIRKLKDSNIVIIYVTHYLDEIFEICDKVTVLRDGHIVSKWMITEVTKKQIIRDMIGQDIEKITEDKGIEIGEKILEVKNITGIKYPRNVSFELNKGEILGIWGLMGSGRTELFRTLLGFDKMKNGQIFYSNDGYLKEEKSSQFFKNTGYVTEGRHFDGLFLQMPLWQNMTSASLKRFASKFLNILKSKNEKYSSREYMDKVDIVAVNENMLAYQLSGGNQQKLVIAKWFMREPKIIFMDEPTKGVDVGAKVEIQKLIFQMAKNGMSFIIISSELEEIMGLCNRIIVLHNGKLISEIKKEDFSKDKLIHDSVGGDF